MAQQQNLNGRADVNGGAVLATITINNDAYVKKAIFNAGAAAAVFSMEESTDGGTTWTNIFSGVGLGVNGLAQLEPELRIKKSTTTSPKQVRCSGTAGGASVSSCNIIVDEEELSL